MIIGDGKYLEQEEKELTLDDVVGSHIDEDMIAKYGQQQRDKIDDEIRELLGGDKLLGNNKLWIVKPSDGKHDDDISNTYIVHQMNLSIV